MKKLVFFLAFPLAAQISNVSVSGVTNTQAVLQYTAPDTTPCMVEVSTSPTFVPLVHDVDPAIFAGSNLDNRPGRTVRLAGVSELEYGRPGGAAGSGDRPPHGDVAQTDDDAAGLGFFQRARLYLG